MRARLQLAGLALVALAVLPLGSPASAEPTGSYFYVAPVGGYTTFDGNLRLPNSGLQDNLYVGGRLGLQWKPWLGLALAGGYTPTQIDEPNGQDVNLLHGSLDLVLSPFQGKVGGPFVFVGGGASRYSFTGSSDEQGNAVAGGGIHFWLSDALGLRVEGRDLMWLPKDDMSTVKTHTLIFSGGITLALGATPRDTDGDGVPDRKDKCLATPKGATVDATGCPGDADGDGVLDGLDACASTPKGATVDAKGCPSDADNDGVIDGLDQCADTPRGATVDTDGCTKDSDGDGVLDGLDRCNDTQKGCNVDSLGCPRDTDGDGVCDGLDKCPGTSLGLKVDKDGCPIEVMERETELLDTGMIRLQDVNFETAKAALLPESLPVLDVVGTVLSKWTELKIEIGGHTDNRGSNAYNQKLSEERVNSVLTYLLQKFPLLKNEQFVVKGYGESKPLMPNADPESMAKNRRVEFKVLNREVLKKESERRRLLQQNEGAAPDSTR